MALEIERKFLCNLTREQAKELSYSSRYIKSIYLENTKEQITRVVKNTYKDGDVFCQWTEKRSIENSIARKELESYLPTKIFDAIDNTYPSISKERFLIDVDGYIWEIDFFERYDFVIAELEFITEEKANNFKDLPNWIIEEVTNIPFYLNCNLAFQEQIKI